MQILGQMMRASVTARQKFNEAAYFYNGMLAQRTNVIIFPYYLSAFLSAFRSVTFYLQKQYAHDARFTSWYPKKQVEMAADGILKMLNNKRTGSVHREPIELFFKQGFEFPKRFAGCIETTHLEVTHDQEPDGRVTTRIRVGVDGLEEEVATEISWHFTEEDKEDVAKHCYLGLQRLDAILEELRALRVSIGLSPDEEIQTTSDATPSES